MQEWIEKERMLNTGNWKGFKFFCESADQTGMSFIDTTRFNEKVWYRCFLSLHVREKQTAFRLQKRHKITLAFTVRNHSRKGLLRGHRLVSDLWSLIIARTLDRKLPILVGLEDDGGSLAEDIDTVSPSSDPRENRRSSFMLPYWKG